MVDMEALRTKGGDGFLADIFEDQQPQVLVLERVEGLRGSDARGFGSASTSIEIVEGGASLGGDGGTDRVDVDGDRHGFLFWWSWNKIEVLYTFPKFQKARKQQVLDR